MKILIINLIFSLIVVTKIGLAQIGNSNSKIQDSLGKMSSGIWKQKTDEGKINASNTFFNAFITTLNNNKTSIPAYDSLPGITRSVSADGLLRIFTWNIPLSDGTNQYWGIIQLTGDRSAIIPLKSDKSSHNSLPDEIISVSQWYGALYYKIIDKEINDKKVYTLLGWDGYNKEANRKLIDILTINDKGNIELGLPVFKTDQGIKSRVIFEYADKANMVLRYDYQAIKIQKKKKIKKISTWLIVMDRLVPMDTTLNGIRKYYVPSGDTYDGFIFKDGYWVLVEDIETSNPAVQMKK